MSASLSTFYNTAAVLSPVLLLTSVIVGRGALRGRGWWAKTPFVVFYLVPPHFVMVFSVVALALGATTSVWWVLGPLLLQIGIALGAFFSALTSPERHDIG